VQKTPKTGDFFPNVNKQTNHLTHNKYVIHSQLNSLNRELRTQVSDTSRSASSICTIWGECALSMVGVEEGREFRFRRDLYSQESTFPLVINDTNDTDEGL